MITTATMRKVINTYRLAVNSLIITKVLSHPYSKIITNNDQGKKIVITIADKFLFHMYFLFSIIYEQYIIVLGSKNTLFDKTK